MSDPSALFRVYFPDECGPDGYPFAWHESVKHDVRALADHRCVRCGHPYRNGRHGNGEWSPCDEKCDHDGPWMIDGFVYQTDDPLLTQRPQWPYTTPHRVYAGWRILTVHHLDGDKRNCRWFNLVALCQRCHLEIQGRVKMNRPWPWEHSEWMKPYVAGFYAFKYAREDLTRVEVEARLEELLTLGRAEESVERMPL